ncbi:MAG TPA: AAA domain-containing protein [Solirubrobacterales bacterium]
MSGGRILDGRYALPDDFRNGGMARVYKAADLQEGSRIVAVKILKKKLDDRVAALAFERETQALLNLSHPNIVEMLDAGRDPETNDRYLVFEWMEKDLGSVLDYAPAWGEYLRRWGMPILRGLAHAHEANVVHRDLKPANVMVDEAQRPRISDFGIAKRLSAFQPGLTLSDWRSPPYSPPEGEDATHSHGRDVYAFGVMSLLILTGVDPGSEEFEDPYEAVEHALGCLDAPEDLADLLARCASSEPAERPEDAVVALAALERITEERSKQAGQALPVIYLSLSQKVRRFLDEEFELGTPVSQERFVLDELTEGAGISELDGDTFDDGSSTEGHYLFYGGSVRLHGILSQARDRFHVVGCMAMRPSFLERERERHCSVAAEWRFGPDEGVGTAGVAELERRLEEHNADPSRHRERDSAEGLIARWRRLLTALRTVEMDRTVKQVFRERSIDGRTVLFKCHEDVPVELLGPAVVESEDSGYVRGVVIVVDGKKALMRIKDGDPRDIPAKGEVRTDTGGTTVAIKRQHRALDAIEEDRSVRSDLKSLIVRPTGAASPIPVEIGDWFQQVDEAKREIISRALGSSDVMHIEGPPGTGKTTLITELVLQHLRVNPEGRILVSAKTHAALDNVLERLAALDPELRLIRAGRAEDDRVAPGAQEYLVERQIKKWRKNAERRGRRFLAKWAKERNLSERDVEIATRFDEMASLIESLARLEAELAPLEQERREAGRTTRGGTSASVEELDTLAEQIDELKASRQDLLHERDEAVDRLVALRAAQRKTELRNADPVELRDRAMKIVPSRSPDFEECSRMVKLMAEWRARFGRGPGFSGAALSRAQVVASTCVGFEGIDGADAIEFDLCIVDESSQATPPEVLIPMTRASSWILVGDSKQLPPFVDEALRDPEVLAEHNLRAEDASDTLFSRWATGLPAANRAELTLQHRMVPEISELISHCFYEGKLESAFGKMRADIAPALPAPVTWYSTSGARNRHERADGTSWVNEHESRAARSLLSLLDLAAEKPLEVAVLTGYAPQVASVQRALSGQSWKHLEVECSTIDAYQGRESDVVVYLVTRSNPKGKIGFLRERPRLNVALSRAREALMIIGDQEFIAGAHGENPFRQVLAYIERTEDDVCAVVEAPR